MQPLPITCPDCNGQMDYKARRCETCAAADERREAARNFRLGLEATLNTQRMAESHARQAAYFAQLRRQRVFRWACIALGTVAVLAPIIDACGWWH